jgi:hypothetical protein
MKQYVQTDLEAGRQVANTLAELIIGGVLVSMEVRTTRARLESSARAQTSFRRPFLCSRKGLWAW